MEKKKTYNPVNFYKVIPKELLLQANNPNYDKHKIKIPFRMLICGSSGSYKTKLSKGNKKKNDEK